MTELEPPLQNIIVHILGNIPKTAPRVDGLHYLPNEIAPFAHAQYRAWLRFSWYSSTSPIVQKPNH